MSTTVIEDYQPNLEPGELDAAIGRIVQTQRQSEWLLCRYLADMADGRRFQRVGWYSDVFHYAKERFGLGVKITRERVRMGRTLRSLPQIEKAFLRGVLSYSKVRELTRVAKAEDEHDWLRLAELLPMRELERRVAGEAGSEAVSDALARERWRTAETVEISFHVPAQTWALLRRAMEAARQGMEGSMSDAEALEAVATQALAGLCQPDATSVANPRRSLVLYQCRTCGGTELETGAGAVSLPPDQAKRLSEGARVVDLATEGREEATTEGTMPAAVRRAVLARDRGSCRLCGRSRYVDIHHLTPQSRGGGHSRENCLVLCSACHGAVHAGKVRAKGSAEDEVEWLDAEGRKLYERDRAIGASEAMAGRGRKTHATDAPIGASVVMAEAEPIQGEDDELIDFIFRCSTEARACLGDRNTCS
ncbi:MAG: hypothetical protein DRI90_15235 [Deltaproteobacteria bacterium]|nr:MAG: hypothetical protein DRI90_15235 [Deltaproteobacteria bacterium]